MEELPGLSNGVNWILLGVCLAAFGFLFVSYLRLHHVADVQGREHDPLEAPWFPSTMSGLFVVVMAMVLLYIPAGELWFLLICIVLVLSALASFAGIANEQRRKLWLEEGPEAY